MSTVAPSWYNVHCCSISQPFLPSSHNRHPCITQSRERHIAGPLSWKYDACSAFFLRTANLTEKFVNNINTDAVVLKYHRRILGYQSAEWFYTLRETIRDIEFPNAALCLKTLTFSKARLPKSTWTEESSIQIQNSKSVYCQNLHDI